jgi:two-component system chemotaxis response regulator CheB
VPGHDIIVIGASAGGVEATSRLVRDLPRSLPAAVFVVVHMPEDASSMLAHILDRAGPLPAHPAVDGQPIVPGHIYVAVPGRHLLVGRGHAHVVHGPRENRARPAVDPLFRTAALAYGPRVIGVVLTGALDDGTAGLLAIKRRGGLAVVQDPRDALMPSMPESALEYVKVDAVLPLDQIGARLAELAAQPAAEASAGGVPADMDLEARLVALDGTAMSTDDRDLLGTLTAYTCPECKGPLWEVRDGQLLRFRCRTGHAFTVETMLAGQEEAVEQALWTALNVLEENQRISERLAADARQRNATHLARRLDERARDKRKQAEVLRRVLHGGNQDEVAAIEEQRAAESNGRRHRNGRRIEQPNRATEPTEPTEPTGPTEPSPDA